MIDRKNSNKKLIKKKGKSPGNRSRKPASSATMAAYNKRNYISRGLGFELPEWLVNIFGTLDAPVRGRSFGQSSRQKSAFRINFRELVYYHRKKLYIK